MERVGPSLRLRGLLDAGLSAMLLALVGVLMLQIGGSSRWVWQGSGIAGLVFVASIESAAFRREKLRRHLPGFKRYMSHIMFSLVASTFAGFAIISAGLAGDFGFQVYVGMLCLLLVICCTMFVLVIASLMSSTQGDDHEPGAQD